MDSFVRAVLRHDPLGDAIIRLLCALDAHGGTACLTLQADADWQLDDFPVADLTVWWLDARGLIDPDPAGEGRITLTDRGRAYLGDLQHPGDPAPVDEQTHLFVIGNALVPQRRLVWLLTDRGHILPVSLRRRGNDARLTARQLEIEVGHILETLRERYEELAAENGPYFNDDDFEPWRHAGKDLARFPEAALAAVFGSLQDGEAAA